MKTNKKINILLLVSGSIAAVRIPLLISQLVKENYEVKCVLTKNAEKLIQPISISILSRNNCFIDNDQWDHDQSNPLHINLSKWADVIIMAPLTATTLSKWVYGNAEGLVPSILTASINKPVIVAPAMNTNMWENKFVRRNYENLKTLDNVLTLNPSSGLLACDQFGIGKLPSNDLIILALKFMTALDGNYKFNDLSNKKFLITGGATVEEIDPARRVTNKSSGMMSLLLAQVARFRGAQVKYIHGNLEISNNLTEGLEKYKIFNGAELRKTLKQEISNYDYLLMNAAVTDISLKKQTSSKLSKDKLKNYFANHMELVPDILSYINKMKKDNQIFVGFCAYTGNHEDLRLTIKKKFNIKGCNFIFANPIDIDGQGFGIHADNGGWLFSESGIEKYIEKTSKLHLANQLISQIISFDK